MSGDVVVVWDEALAGYDLGPSHPLRPLRLDLTMRLAGDLGVLDRPGVRIEAPAPAADDVLELVHDPDYVGYVRSVDADLAGRAQRRYGFGTPDNPVFPRMHAASALVTGASVDAARAVWEGRAEHAVNIAGGLHHAMRGRASGFCVYDDPAVAVAWLLSAGATRVAYVDVDVHHGDGVQAAFYDDPRVLTVSLHESGRTLFPGTGWPDETGTGHAAGTSVNVALPAGTGDAGFLRAFTAVVPDLLRAFRPQVLVTQLGCDTHERDPLAHLTCSVDGQRETYRMLHALAHEVCGGRWVALGGGGYDAVQVVPRAWTHVLAEVTGAPVDGETPAGWQEYAQRESGRRAPGRLGDGQPVDYSTWEGAEPWPGTDRLDEAVAATRAAVFPAHGLDPLAPASAPPATLPATRPETAAPTVPRPSP